jgi:hypothetical protein
MLVFKDKNNIKAPASKDYVDIVIERVKGSDGRITVEYETKEIDGGAKEGIDFRKSSGILEFNNGDTE